MATYFVRSSGGNDSNDGLSFANGWATVQKAADTAVGSDLVLICADGNHSPTVTIDFDTNAGAPTTPITFRGAGATGTDDGTIATIDGGSLGASDDLVDLGINATLIFENLIFSNATQYNVFNDVQGIRRFQNCRFTGATSDGFRTQSSAGGSSFVFINCEFDGNGGDGYGINADARGHARFYRCSFHDNTTHGAHISPHTTAPLGSPTLDRCLFYDNGGAGVFVNDTSGGPIFIYHCTFALNTGNGIEFEVLTDVKVFIHDTILRSNGGYGIDTNGSDVDMPFLERLCSDNNTSGHIDINGGTLMGTGHVLEDPQFASETDGSEDFTPGNANLKVTISLPVGLA